MQFQALFIGEGYSVLDYSSTGFSLTGSKVCSDVWISFGFFLIQQDFIKDRH